MPTVTLSRFFAMLIAMVMLVAPIAGPASAMAVPPPAPSVAAQHDHCADLQGSADSGSDDQSCCVAMCAAVSAAALPVQAPPLGHVAGQPSLSRFADIYLAELATPPPRQG